VAVENPKYPHWRVLRRWVESAVQWAEHNAWRLDSAARGCVSRGLALIAQPFSLQIPQRLERVHDRLYVDFVLVAVSQFKPSCHEHLFRHSNTLFEQPIVRLQPIRFVNFFAGIWTDI